MNYHILTLFPEMIERDMKESIMGRAQAAGHIQVEAVNIRDFAGNKHNRVDDYPYGGGAGMVMQAEPVYAAWRHVAENIGHPARVIYLSPQGRVFRQSIAQELAGEEELIFLCGHYEGIDERVLQEVVTDYLSIGDYVLTGGELAALVVMDAVTRLVPGVLHNNASAQTESFTDSLLEYPQYTRPEVWRGHTVPEVLLSGNHKKLAEWYREQSILRTAGSRPDLLERAEMTQKERQMIQKWMEEQPGKVQEGTE